MEVRACEGEESVKETYFWFLLVLQLGFRQLLSCQEVNWDLLLLGAAAVSAASGAGQRTENSARYFPVLLLPVTIWEKVSDAGRLCYGFELKGTEKNHKNNHNLQSGDG